MERSRDIKMMDDVNLPYTMKLLEIHRYVMLVVSVLVVMGASISAIRIGNAPVAGPLVVLVIMGLFYGMVVWQNGRIRRGLQEGDFRAWLQAVIWASVMSLLIVGIPAARELLSPTVRARFIG
jgi:hypothetical protein